MQSNPTISNHSTTLKLFKWLTGSFYSSCISLLHSDLITSAFGTSFSSGSLALCDKQWRGRRGKGWGTKRRRRRLEKIRCTCKTLLHSNLPSWYLCETWPRLKKGQTPGAWGLLICLLKNRLFSFIGLFKMAVNKKKTAPCQGLVTRLAVRPHNVFQSSFVLIYCREQN